MDTAAIKTLLDELKLPYTSEQVESDLVSYTIRVDEAENIEVTALVYDTEEGTYLRLMSYVDELDPAAALEQLKVLMTLNGELPVGAYCMDPDEEVIYATVNSPVAELDAEYLSWLIEFLLVAQEIYDQELSGEGPEVVAEG
jgi:hypothetical protein